MPKIKTGNKVPDFSLPMTGGGTWSLKDAAGRKLVIYFYPRDQTTGCTREAQDFRDHYGAFRKAGVTLVGVSRDSVASHEKFAAQRCAALPAARRHGRDACASCSMSSNRKASTAEKYLGSRAQHLPARCCAGGCGRSGAR